MSSGQYIGGGSGRSQNRYPPANGHSEAWHSSQGQSPRVLDAVFWTRVSLN
jgi:hypothetical protein